MLTKAHIALVRAGKATDLRFPPETEIDWEPGHRVRISDALWFMVLSWKFDQTTDELVYRVRKCAMPDTPRLLMPAGRRPTRTELGYTDFEGFAMHGEPEAVDEATQEQITRDGWAGFNARERHRALDRRLLALEERLKLAWGDAQRLRIDVSSDLRVIERRVEAMESKTDRSRAA